jgi:hypothetical protein
MRSNAQRYRMGFSAALFFVGVAGGAWLACGPANQHNQGEVCSPYAEGAGTTDGGATEGDCKPNTNLACVCNDDAGCLCAPQCTFIDGGVECTTGYGCVEARDVIEGETGLYCFPS